MQYFQIIYQNRFMDVIYVLVFGGDLLYILYFYINQFKSGFCA